MNELTARLMPHLMLAPIVLPMLSAALMLLLREERQRVKFALGLVSTVLGLGVAVLLMLWTDQAGAPVNLGVYMPGNWPMPFGISLALDPPDRHDAGADLHGGPGLADLLQRPLASRGNALSLAVPVPADGPERRLPHGGPVQPVRVLRDHARGLLRPVAAWLGPGAHPGGPALHRHQPGRLVAVPHRRVHALRPDRHAEHGRPGARHSPDQQCRPRAAAFGSGHPGHRLPDQGGHVAR